MAPVRSKILKSMFSSTSFCPRLGLRFCEIVVPRRDVPHDFSPFSGIRLIIALWALTPFCATSLVLCARDELFLNDHRDVLQGKCNNPGGFATTTGGTCTDDRAFSSVPIVVTTNYTTKNLPASSPTKHLECSRSVGGGGKKGVGNFPKTRR